MKKMKMSLQSIQGVLSRDEMRQIMAGSEGSYCGTCTPQYSDGPPYSGPPESCITDPYLGGACMGCGGLCY